MLNSQIIWWFLNYFLIYISSLISLWSENITWIIAILWLFKALLCNPLYGQLWEVVMSTCRECIYGQRGHSVQEVSNNFSLVFCFDFFICMEFFPGRPIACCDKCDKTSRVIANFFNSPFGFVRFWHICFEATCRFRIIISSWGFGPFFIKEMWVFFTNVFVLKSILPESTWTDFSTARPVFCFFVFLVFLIF